MVYCDTEADKDDGKYYWKPFIEYSYCDVNAKISYSPLTNSVVCYTAEALKYGQTGWVLAIVIF